MFELTIEGTVYSFNFGFGFYRELDKAVKSKPDNNGVQSNVGIQYKIASVMDGNPLAIVDVLDVANKYAKEPRVTRALLESYIEGGEVDIEEIGESLLDFFRKSNTLKGTMKALDIIQNLSTEEKVELLQKNQ